MLEFQAALEKDPAVDLMSMFSDSYIHEHRIAHYNQLSYAAEINFRLLNELHDALTNEPEVNLLSVFPKNYSRRINMATGPKVVLNGKQKDQPKAPEFRTRLVLAKTATIVYPLSEKVIALLEQCSGPGKSSISDEKTLVLALKKLIWDSPTLWESPTLKVVTGNGYYTEYTSMQFLIKQAPDIPAPRPHGILDFGPFRVIFILVHEEKLSIQRQLDEIFSRLRAIRPKDGDMLGGVCGEGVKELRVDDWATFKDITTTKGFNDLQFSARHHGSNTYVRLLRSFLEHDPSLLANGSVFTHGDVRTANIMVKQDPSRGVQYVITGIIDWEDSGFYPFYYECTVLTRTLSLVDENDWYFYLPQSISPLKFPVHWLVDRLWGIHLRTT
ncbi:aminoglycoside phosphotransferase family protein [Aspergillus ibericus CBS 121593]|uniref:Aminoglycoside phosphotransferase domain-containing protein n=1 Tax=Aspergillus ibericus CBS 121593 TaxID=1448316 RepID=A0A395GTN6_9EURO|nr:hypothetical protein BO80DRAFT_457122 [Aspergillus ibericus CBS 121593]RAK98799.1 hypothetical protein BO80DRAFT_457122 [Aspergillus ibericus CBS 121593]